MGGAGILPVALHESKLYFLFGKENKYEDSAPGFADFGGGHEKGETHTETAIREGSEELSGFLGDGDDMKKLLLKHGSYTIDYKQYRTFIVPIKYDKKLEYYFNKNLRFVLSHLDPKIVAQTRIFEKEEIRWVCYDELMNMKKEFRSFFQNIVSKINKERAKIELFVRGGKSSNNKHKSKRKHTKNGGGKKIKSKRKKGNRSKTRKNTSYSEITLKSCCRCEQPIKNNKDALGGRANGVICLHHRSCQSCWWGDSITGKRNEESDKTKNIGLVDHPFHDRKPKCPGCVLRSNGLPYPPYVEPVDIGTMNSDNIIEID
tara:strand:+ start:333 stop:1283 length:951 start_codon:yes stop_codon:yes gene_type:complete